MKQKKSILTWMSNNSFLPFNVNVESSLKISNSIFKNDEFQVEFEKNDNPRFEFFHNQKNVFLPKKYSVNNSLYKFITIIIMIKKSLFLLMNGARKSKNK